MNFDPLVPPIRRPLVGVAFAYMAGTGVGFFIHRADFVLPACVAMLVLVTWWSAFHRISTATLLLAIALMGAWRSGQYFHAGSVHSLERKLLREREHVELRAHVVAVPQVYYKAHGAISEVRFVACVDEIRDASGWTKASDVVYVIWRKPPQDAGVAYGQRWQLGGVVERRHSLWTWWGGAHVLRVFDAAATCQQGERCSRVVRTCLNWRSWASQRLAAGPGEQDVSVRFTRALILGERSGLDERIRDIFAATGMLHVLAVSGLHVGILAYVLALLLQGMGMARRPAAWGIIGGLLVYAVIVGWRASALRATVMSAVLLGSAWFWRRPDVLSALALAAIGVLAVCPAQLSDPAFILSFLAVAGLVIISGKLSVILPALSRMPADEDWSIEPPGRFERIVAAGRRMAKQTFVASVAVWLVTTPLIIRWFHLFSPIALLGNILVIPLAFVILFTSVLSVLLGSLHPLIAEVFNYANAVFVRLLLGWADALAQVRGGFFRVGTWPIEWMIVWYVGLFLLLTARGVLRRLTVIALGVALLAWSVWWWCDVRRARLVVLEPTESGVVLIEGPWRRRVLIHAGPAYLVPQLVRSLHAHGVESLDALALIEPDAEHVGGTAQLLRYIPIKEVWCSPWVRASRTTLQALQAAQQRGARIRRLACGDIIQIGAMEFETLYPDGHRCLRQRAEPLVLRAQWGRCAVLFAGGVTREIETAILRGCVDPAADLLVVGGRNLPATCSAAWLHAVRPRRIVMAIGSEGQWVEPSSDWLNRLKATGIRILRADRDREIVLDWLPHITAEDSFRPLASTARSELL